MKTSMISLPYLYMQMFWGKKVKQGRKMSEMSIESFVQAKESTIDDWAFGSLVKCKLKIFKNINWLASIYNPCVSAISFWNHYDVLRSLTFFVSNAKSFSLNYEFITRAVGKIIPNTADLTQRLEKIKFWNQTRFLWAF